jgi:hypothetical protein
VLLPYGILISALGVYALVRTVASPPIAFLAPIALLLLPDASDVGLRNGFFGFRWMLLTVPGSGYGLGVACTAVTLMVIWQDQRRSVTLWLGLIATAALFQFRAHFFVLLAPALAMTLAWETDYVRRRARPVAAAMLAVSVVGVVCIAAIPIVRQAWLQFSAFGLFMDTVHTAMSPTAYDGMYEMIGKQYGRSSAWIFGLFAIVPVALGALTIASPLGLWLALRRTGWQRFDSFPIWCFLLWLGIVVWAPQTAHGDPTEYQNRTVVLVYAVAFIWTLVWLDRASQRRAFILPAFIIAAVGSAAAAGSNEDLARPRFAWGSQFYGVKLDEGLFEAATFVRTHAVVGDTFALIPSDRLERLDDAATRFAALANVPAYVARAGVQVLNGEDRRVTVEQRLAVLTEIAATDNIDVVSQKLQTIGVAFLVTLGDRGPLFDPDRRHAAFSTHGAAVYRAGSPSMAR